MITHAVSQSTSTTAFPYRRAMEGLFARNKSSCSQQSATPLAFLCQNRFLFCFLSPMHDVDSDHVGASRVSTRSLAPRRLEQGVTFTPSCTCRATVLQARTTRDSVLRYARKATSATLHAAIIDALLTEYSINSGHINMLYMYTPQYTCSSRRSPCIYIYYVHICIFARYVLHRTAVPTLKMYSGTSGQPR